MLELLVGAWIGAIAVFVVAEIRIKQLRNEKAFAEAKYNSLKGFFDARVLAVKAKADEAKKRA